MKSVLKNALILGILTLLFCGAAYADDAGIYDLKPEAGVTVSSSGALGAETLTVEAPSTAPYYLIMVMKGETNPTADNLFYIDQKAPADGTVRFTVLPKTMTTGDYSIYGADAGGKKLLATFKYNQSAPAFILGDVDDDKYVTATDALWVLQNAAGNRAFTAMQKLAGDVDKDAYITATDALWILQAAAGNRKLG